MSRNNSDWEEDDYRSFKKPKRVDREKDVYSKHRNAIYDMLDNEEEEDYFDDDYSDDNYDEIDDRY